MHERTIKADSALEQAFFVTKPPQGVPGHRWTCVSDLKVKRHELHVQTVFRGVLDAAIVLWSAVGARDRDRQPKSGAQGVERPDGRRYIGPQ